MLFLSSLLTGYDAAKYECMSVFTIATYGKKLRRGQIRLQKYNGQCNPCGNKALPLYPKLGKLVHFTLFYLIKNLWKLRARWGPLKFIINDSGCFHCRVMLISFFPLIFGFWNALTIIALGGWKCRKINHLNKGRRGEQLQ